jgi:sugar O-acyltransferase (sialic acid O-acetyltransferase NeuD family)
MKSKKLIIFGTGDIAQLAHYYFEHDSGYSVTAFTVDQQFCESDNFEGKPLVAFEKVEQSFKPGEFAIFIAVSYRDMNKFRAEKYLAAKRKGYEIASYVSSKASYLSQYPPGENAFILEDNTIQPFVRIGNNVTLWSGNHIGHHSVINDHNFISSHVVISGHCVVSSYCFLGVNSTLAHNVVIAEGTLLGGGVFMSRNSEPDGVYVSPKPVKLDKSSGDVNL